MLLETRPRWAFVGLGNPGFSYRHTRHNVGFMVVDELARRWRLRFKVNRPWSSVAIGREIILVKPLTFMNASGKAVTQVAGYFGIQTESIVVIHDDADLRLGQLRIRPGGGDGGHRGVRSIIQELGCDRFPRVRIGIGRPPDTDLVTYVLTRFTKQELGLIRPAIQKAADACCYLLKASIDQVMNKYNS